MSPGGARYLDRLERWCPTIFLVGGVSWGVMVVLAAYEELAALSGDPYIWITDPLLLLGAIAGLAGLLGFYPYVADVAPRVAMATATLVAMGVGAWGIYVVGNLIESLSTTGPFGATVTVADYFYVVVLLALLAGFLAFGVISAYTAIPSRTVGVLMLLPAVALVVHSVAGTLVALPDPVLVEWGVMAVVMIALWALLREPGEPYPERGPQVTTADD